MPVAINNQYKQWIAVVGEESQTPIETVNSSQILYIRFNDVGHQFVVANMETAETFSYISGDNFIYDKTPLFEYNKSTKQMRQCEPANPIL